MDPILTMKVSATFQVQEWNSLITALNKPSDAPTLFLANFINAIQQQLGPQVDALKANLTEKTEEAPVETPAETPAQPPVEATA